MSVKAIEDENVEIDEENNAEEIDVDNSEDIEEVDMENDEVEEVDDANSEVEGDTKSNEEELKEEESSSDESAEKEGKAKKEKAEKPKKEKAEKPKKEKDEKPKKEAKPKKNSAVTDEVQELRAKNKAQTKNISRQDISNEYKYVQKPFKPPIRYLGSEEDIVNNYGKSVTRTKLALVLIFVLSVGSGLGYLSEFVLDESQYDRFTVIYTYEEYKLKSYLVIVVALVLYWLKMFLKFLRTKKRLELIVDLYDQDSYMLKVTKIARNYLVRVDIEKFNFDKIDYFLVVRDEKNKIIRGKEARITKKNHKRVVIRDAFGAKTLDVYEGQSKPKKKKKKKKKLVSPKKGK